MTPEEIGIGEIGRSVQRIEQQLIALATELREELRDTRHKANDALTGIQLQRVKNEQYENAINRHESSLERAWMRIEAHEAASASRDDLEVNRARIENLEKTTASQDAVDKYRKWLIGVVGVSGILGIISLVVSLQA